MEERELHFQAEQPLIGWRLFRVRRSESGFVLSAPFIHNPGGKSAMDGGWLATMANLRHLVS